MYTDFYEVIRELAREYGVPVRQPVPEPVYGRIKLKGRGGAAAAIMPVMLRFAVRHPLLALHLLAHATPAAFKRKADALRQAGIATPDWFVDAFFGNPTIDCFISILKQLPPGVGEMMVHPAMVDDPLRALGGGYVAQRETELAVLLDPRVREAVATYRVELVDFSFLRRA
ncbi:MAG: ChbG/HpnK family deacetylase [Chloroflexi bacterium]|nr:ChbG/HpnK family deacetylase [Chloroflexota bacterium]